MILFLIMIIHFIYRYLSVYSTLKAKKVSFESRLVEVSREADVEVPNGGDGGGWRLLDGVCWCTTYCVLYSYIILSHMMPLSCF